MNAVISGRCATALLIDGERLMSIHADAIQQPVLRQSADLPFLFGDCNDLQFLEDITFDKVAAQLKRACDNDDELQMILILLDSELSSEVREEAAEALEELLTDELPTIKFAEIPTKIFDEPLTYERRRAPIKLAKTIEIDFKDQIEVEEIAQTLKEKLLELPTKYIQVLELIYYQDYRESEAAEKLGISVDKLYSLKSEALKRLRKLCANDSRLKP